MCHNLRIRRLTYNHRYRCEYFTLLDRIMKQKLMGSLVLKKVNCIPFFATSAAIPKRQWLPRGSIRYLPHISQNPTGSGPWTVPIWRLSSLCYATQKLCQFGVLFPIFHTAAGRYRYQCVRILLVPTKTLRRILHFQGNKWRKNGSHCVALR